MLAMIALATVAAFDSIDVYVGTYTSPTGAKGVYRCRLDRATGGLSQPELVAEMRSPSYLALHPNGKFLYAVDETSRGDVHAFAVQGDGTLRAINVASADTAGPCHVALDPGGRTLFTAGYGGGALAAYPVHADGSVGAATFHLKNSGSGPNRSRQEGPHLHAVYSDPKSRFAYACDLGTDEVLTFRLDAKSSTLTPCEPRASKVPAGGGPRHLAFGKGGNFAYVNDEMGSAVTVFAIDAKTGHLNEVQTISTLPDVADPSNSTAEIEVHPSGKFLYVSNRGHDSIAVFAIGADGKLSRTEVVPAAVKIPRGFGVDPSGRWLVVAGQSTDDLTTFEIDAKTGKLRTTGVKVHVGKPVCIVFRKS